MCCIGLNCVAVHCSCFGRQCNDQFPPLLSGHFCRCRHRQRWHSRIAYCTPQHIRQVGGERARRGTQNTLAPHWRTDTEQQHQRCYQQRATRNHFIRHSKREREGERSTCGFSAHCFFFLLLSFIPFTPILCKVTHGFAKRIACDAITNGARRQNDCERATLYCCCVFVIVVGVPGG